MMKFNYALKKYVLLKKGETVVLAISGGVDSMVMLYLFNSIKDAMKLELIVAHLNHNLRSAESKRDFLFVKKAASALGLEFYGKTLKKDELKKLKGVSLQAAAREKRYDFLEGAARKHRADVVALAHNANDQAETMLMRFLNGSGLAGISGIPVKRGLYMRPLLDVTRREIEAFAAEHNINYVTDSSNLKDDYLRNDIRRNLIPLIEKRYNPNFIETQVNTSKILSEDNNLLDAISSETFSEVSRGVKRGIGFNRTKLKTLHGALLARIFLKAVKVVASHANVYSPHALAFIEIIKSRKPNSSFALPHGLCIKREYETIFITKAELFECAAPFNSLLKVPGFTMLGASNRMIKAEIVKKKKSQSLLKGIKQSGFNSAYFDVGSADLRLCVRSIRPGDRIMPLGMSGHRKLKEIFIDKKIPVAERARIPIVSANDEVIWVPGIVRSNLYKIRTETKKALRLTLKAIR